MSPDHTAMIRAMFPSDVFIPRQRSVKVNVEVCTREYKADVRALLDSGATDNFIAPFVVNRFNIPTFQLPRPKIIRNVDGTKNSIGKVTKAVNLKVRHNKVETTQCFFVIDLGSDSMLLGYPFLAASNPQIDWRKGIFHGRVTASTDDSHLWSPQMQAFRAERLARLELRSKRKRHDPHFIPSNEKGVITYGRATKATELAVEANKEKKEIPWQEQVPPDYHHFGKVFSSEEATRFPISRPWDHAIELLPDAPRSLDCKTYPLAPAHQEGLDTFLKEHLAKGYIRRSNSPYAAPFFFVRKKDGKWHPVQDYRRLNEWTVRNVYPLPLIKELIQRLAKKVWFTKFDVRWGYNNVRIKEGDEWKAAFKTNRGLFEPTVMFFGLTNSPATFQTMMDDFFREEIAKGDVIIYMDDILIATERDLNGHRKVVTNVLKKLQDNDLFLKPEKCVFHKREVEYLGVIVGNGQVKMDPVKVSALTDWPPPTKVTEVRSFLGFGNYYKDFIEHYSQMARPLHQLTKKNVPWSWGDPQEMAFRTLKEKFTSYPVLRNPDHTQPFQLDTDASAFAVGATISQEFSDGRHPVAYFSKTLTPPEQNYDIYDRELLAIIYAVKAFKYLLLGAQHKFLVRSDHNNLKYFKSSHKITPRQARWMEFLQDYDFTLEHLPGKANTIADLLSRRTDLSKGVNINENVTILPENLFAKATSSHSNKVFVEDDPETRRKILREVHDSPVAGHPGISNTWQLIKRHYYGPRLRKFVEMYVKGCAKCQESKVITHMKRAPLQSFDTPVQQGPFQYVSMDLITDLPPSNRYDSILTIVDQGCSKAAKFIPCRKNIDGQGIATLYFRHLFPWYGVPKRIISDRDPRFTSNFSTAVCKATNIQQNLSTAFHPRTDGQTERMNQWIETYLRNFVTGRQNNWSELLPIAEFAHNSWKHESTKYSPHELISGFVPSAKLMPLDDQVPSAQLRLAELVKARSDAERSLQRRIKHPVIPRTLKVNQKVWLDGRNIKTKAPSKKLSPRRYGPFKVIEKVSPVNYRLQLPPSMKIHNVFHIDLLIPFLETEAYGKAFTQPPPEVIDGEEEYEVEEILSHRSKGRARKKEYLVRWKGYPSSDNSWVHEDDLHASELLTEYQRSLV